MTQQSNKNQRGPKGMNALVWESTEVNEQTISNYQIRRAMGEANCWLSRLANSVNRPTSSPGFDRVFLIHHNSRFCPAMWPLFFASYLWNAYALHGIAETTTIVPTIRGYHDTLHKKRWELLVALEIAWCSRQQDELLVYGHCWVCYRANCCVGAKDESATMNRWLLEMKADL